MQMSTLQSFARGGAEEQLTMGPGSALLHHAPIQGTGLCKRGIYIVVHRHPLHSIHLSGLRYELLVIRGRPAMGKGVLGGGLLWMVPRQLRPCPGGRRPLCRGFPLRHCHL